MPRVLVENVPPERVTLAPDGVPSPQPTPDDLRAAGLTEEEWAWACQAMERRLEPEGPRRAGHGRHQP